MSSIDIVAPLDHLDKEPRPPGPSLQRVLETLGEGGNGRLWHSDWAWENYERAVLALAREFGLWRLLEIGGGRDPAFATAARENGLRLIVNDIDPLELARVPEGVDTACFDVAGDISRRPELYGAFDIVASRMVFEHIRNVPAAWRNIYRILRPGGVGLAFFPTLYAWPFLLNHMLPDDIARRIVERVFPARAADGDNPVFPPVYHWCYGDEAKLRRMLDPIGFSEIHILPFWGHHYLDRVPVLRELDFAFNRFCAAIDWRFFTTYAYVVVRK
jgi:SAM-dependent methyltransferase